MIEINARNDPKANVDIPETPCPIVHPSDRTPPIPINTPPIACLVKSRFVTNHSNLKLFEIIAYVKEYGQVTNAKLKLLDSIIHNIHMFFAKEDGLKQNLYLLQLQLIGHFQPIGQFVENVPHILVDIRPLIVNLV